MFKNTLGKGNTSVKEFGIKNVLGLIISAIFFIFFIASTIITIKAGQLIIGILYLFLALLVLVPHHRLRVTSPLKFLIISILFIVVAGINAKNVKPADQKYEYFKLNEVFNLKVGDKTFPTTIQKVSQETQIVLSEKVVATSGYFLVVTGDIKNSGSEAVDFSFPKEPMLKDAQGRNYSLYAKTLANVKLQPSVAKSFSFVFEIPKDSTGLSFIIKDKTDTAKSIDLKR